MRLWVRLRYRKDVSGHSMASGTVQMLLSLRSRRSRFFSSSVKENIFKVCISVGALIVEFILFSDKNIV